MKTEVSNGEIVDKYAILGIKANRIDAKIKLKHIFFEMYEVEKSYLEIKAIAEQRSKTQAFAALFHELCDVNGKLWDIEDKIRKKESKQEFDEEFIELARSVYKTNDERSEIKRQINEMTGSQFIEEKSYTKYE